MHEIILLIVALILRKVHFECLFLIVLYLIEYALTCCLITTLVALLVLLMLPIQILQHRTDICLEFSLQTMDQDDFVLVLVLKALFFDFVGVLATLHFLILLNI